MGQQNLNRLCTHRLRLFTIHTLILENPFNDLNHILNYMIKCMDAINSCRQRPDPQILEQKNPALIKKVELKPVIEVSAINGTLSKEQSIFDTFDYIVKKEDDFKTWLEANKGKLTPDLEADLKIMFAKHIAKIIKEQEL